jgi:hypothetical protein
MLATCMVGVVPSANAVTLNATDDGLSLAGMFFAKLEILHAKHMSGETGQVCWGALSHRTCMLLQYR